jgi:hypothetical protein
MIMRASHFALGLAALVGCANDPDYIAAPKALDAGFVDPATPNQPAQAKMSLQLPIKTETAADKTARDALAKKLAPVLVPYVKVGDIEVELAWNIRNLDDKDGVAEIQLNGANEFFSYDPTLINLAAPDDDEAPPTPGLSGDIPISVPAHTTMSGLFTEDQLREASIDLDQITRGNVSPFRATLTVSKNAPNFQPLTAPMPAVEDYVQTPTGPIVPRDAFAYMTRVDLVFKPTTHMTLDFNVRVRDLRGIMHDMLLDAKPDELQAFKPAVYNPTPAATPAP